jgi:hypothetical protein
MVESFQIPYMCIGAPRDFVALGQMEGTWRLESTSVGLHPCEASFKKQCEGCADTAWGGY